MTVTSYEYVAVDRTGTRRRASLHASNRKDAFRKITASGLTPVSIRVQRSRTPLPGMGKQVKLAQIAALTRELSVLVEAKIPIAHGISSIAEHEQDPELRNILTKLASDIEAGASITEALAEHPGAFDDVYIETMRAAESSGNLVSVTQHLADMLERQIETRQRIRQAMAYPVIVITAVGLALGVILGFVVPKFEGMFAASGAELPLATRVVQSVGHFVNAYWWALGLGGLGLMIVLMRVYRTRPGRAVFEELWLRLPWLHLVIVSGTAARFSRVFGIALDSGLSVIDAMRLGGSASGRPLFNDECQAMAARLAKGQRLSKVLEQTRYLPPFARRMFGAGRDTKDLASACSIIARHYDRESSNLTRNINTIIEPILTVLMAAIVLVVALAVFLPMWQMVSLNK